MTERTRHRLTGSIFLIALAFILLPMLFDGRGMDPVELGAITEPEPRDNRPLVRPPQPVVDPEVVAGVAVLRDAVDAEGFLSATGSRLGEPVLRQEPARMPAATQAEGPAWAVQLASFSDRSNAVALRDRLRADGYPAILSDLRQGATTRTRVAIGPILSRDEATKLQQELSNRYQLSPIIVAFGP
jgi:DedD protein